MNGSYIIVFKWMMEFDYIDEVAMRVGFNEL